jgi:hypothetical protein
MIISIDIQVSPEKIPVFTAVSIALGTVVDQRTYLPNTAAGLGFGPRLALIQSQACYHYTTRQLYSGPFAV